MVANAERIEATLTLAASGLESEFRRFENIPMLMARDPIFTELLSGKLDPARRKGVDRFLLTEAKRIGAAELFVLDQSGIVIAASSHEGEGSFLGSNFSFRPYFRQALDSGRGRFFALGQVSGERGFYVASSVRGANRTAGVLALKFTFDAFEEKWRRGEPEIAVSDVLGVVIMSSRPDWLFTTLNDLSAEARSRIDETRQYPAESLRPLVISPRHLTEDLDQVEIEGSIPAADFLTKALPLTVEDWTIRVFVPVAEAKTAAFFVVFSAAAAFAVLGLLGVIGWQRRQALRERFKLQKANEEMLVSRVNERTDMLKRTVDRLEEEVAHRKHAEHELLRAQRELVQSEKLAALGKTSASISHEFNQPLTALRNFAQNSGLVAQIE